MAHSSRFAAGPGRRWSLPERSPAAVAFVALAMAGGWPRVLRAQGSSEPPAAASVSPAAARVPAPVPAYPVAPSPVLSTGQLPASLALSGYLSARQTRRNDSTAFVLNHARLAVVGAPRPYLAFRLAGDLSNTGRVGRDSTVPASMLTDAFVQLTVPRGRGASLVRWLAPALVVGQFRTPFSMEYLTPFQSLKTANRSQVVDRLSTKRDVGAMTQLRVGPWLTLAGAMSNGEGPNASRNPDNQELAVGRLTLRPAPGLAVSGKWANQGTDHRWGYDARLVRGAATVEGEALHRAGRAPGTAAAVPGPAYAAGGGYVLASYRVVPWLEPVAKWERFREEHAALADVQPVNEICTTLGATVRAPDDIVRFQVNWVQKHEHPVARGASELVAQLIAIF